MEQPKFTVIVVCLNAGKKLNKTVESVLSQECRDYEILVKDGGSTDGSVEELKASFGDAAALRVVTGKDAGIYDAMNRAVEEARGKFLIFLNCGDSFFDEKVLARTARAIEKNGGRGIYYGDTVYEPTGARVASPPRITPFVCYRNIPCHQGCFYERTLFDKKKYDVKYRVRADYDHFLYCCLRGGVNPLYMGFVVASYEGGGYSESRENHRRDRQEHKMITASYLSAGQRFLYRMYLVVTLAPLRKMLANSKTFSGIYNKLKAGLYR